MQMGDEPSQEFLKMRRGIRQEPGGPSAHNAHLIEFKTESMAVSPVVTDSQMWLSSAAGRLGAKCSVRRWKCIPKALR